MILFVSTFHADVKIDMVLTHNVTVLNNTGVVYV